MFEADIEACSDQISHPALMDRLRDAARMPADRGVPMSAVDTYTRTLAALRARGLSVTALPR